MNPSPRHIAYALADLAADEARAAWTHLDDWDALTKAGVDSLLLRHVLEHEGLETEARSVIDAWDRLGARGLLALHGAQDSGKSDAQVRWALRRHREGLATLWVNAVSWGEMGFGNKTESNDIAAFIKAATRADALIIDDVGAGITQGTLYKQAMQGLIHGRGEKPTVISGNLNKASMFDWLGPRLTSRLHETGRAHSIKASLELRGSIKEHVDDPQGRSAKWFASRKMVQYFGCERGERWCEEAGDYVEDFRIGDRLVERAKRLGKDAHAQLEATAHRMGVAWSTVLEQAKRLGRREELAQSGLLSAVSDLGDLVITPGPEEGKPARKLTDRDHSMDPPPELPKSPAWAKDLSPRGDGRSRLIRFGFRVRKTDTGSWRVSYGPKPGTTLHPGVLTELLGWEFAAGMAAS